MGAQVRGEQERLEPVLRGFVRCEVPASELWRTLDGAGSSRHGLAVVRRPDVRRAIERRLAGRTNDGQLAVWAGCLLGFSCFHVEGRATRAALTRLSLCELTEPGLRSLAARLEQ